ncbi:sulfotransferase family 2 domain-containing protein [Litorimonas sp. RW-G-Af-16]|uniref:sulfotransferase family 2 domain-containing protein n=1 Tax=Litorimonas sp. RW-G-Af-16 TaxID=3241168 RepID=UPI00390C779B
MFFPNESLFVHIPKTGGSSLVSAIAGKYLQDEPEEAWDRLAYDRFTIHGYFKKSIWGEEGHPHSYISEYDQYLKIDDFFKFVILRNPADQLVSLYNQLRKEVHIPSLEHFVLGQEGMTMARVDHYIDQYKYTHIDDELRIDKVFLFDRYAEVQDFVEAHFNITLDRNRRLWKTDPSGETLSPQAKRHFESQYHKSIELYHQFLN